MSALNADSETKEVRPKLESRGFLIGSAITRLQTQNEFIDALGPPALNHYTGMYICEHARNYMRRLIQRVSDPFSIC